jgi:hypothetical protein
VRRRTDTEPLQETLTEAQHTPGCRSIFYLAWLTHWLAPGYSRFTSPPSDTDTVSCSDATPLTLHTVVRRERIGFGTFTSVSLSSF